MNNFKEGSVRYIVFNENQKWHAVALEFNIVETGDNPDATLYGLFEAVRGYIESAIKAGESNVLNQDVDTQNERMWAGIKHNTNNKKLYAFGEHSVVFA